MAKSNDQSWRELELVKEGVYKIWDMYITFYTWFFGLNLLALSWVFSTELPPDFTGNKGLMCTIWIVMNLFVTTTTLILSYHSYRMNRRIQSLLSSRGQSGILVADDLLPRTMTTWGGVANAASLLINASLWFLVYKLPLGVAAQATAK